MAQNPVRPMVFSWWWLLFRICWYFDAASGSIFSQSTNCPYFIPEQELISQLSDSEMVIMATDLRLPLLPEGRYTYTYVNFPKNVIFFHYWNTDHQGMTLPLTSLDNKNLFGVVFLVVSRTVAPSPSLVSFLFTLFCVGELVFCLSEPMSLPEWSSDVSKL